MNRRTRGKAENSYDRMMKSVTGLARQICALNKQAVRQYKPIVESILRDRSRDVRHIEHTLDGLLDFCGHDPALKLYRRLCRHYWDIDPVATAQYVHAYREMWDSENLPKLKQEFSHRR